MQYHLCRIFDEDIRTKSPPGRGRLVPIFSVNDPEFFKRGRYYFDGVWGQAARGAALQQTILRAIAPHPQGLTLDAIVQTITTEGAILQPPLATLQRHDVVRETNGLLHIIVELFRRWVLSLRNFQVREP